MVNPRLGRVRPSDVAAETKKTFIPTIRTNFADTYPTYSILYRAAAKDLIIDPASTVQVPEFFVEVGDPVSQAIYYAAAGQNGATEPEARIPFLCAANERRPGGDWETGCSGYEETLCRRSNLAATLSTAHPQMPQDSHYPIPSSGGILSNSVVLWRGPADDYERLEELQDLPVISVPPTRWPKLKANNGDISYSFPQEKEMMREKMAAALHICLYNGYRRIVIGDFGLGNSYRNPPCLVAEMWRSLFLFDPSIQGHFQQVFFVFEDSEQSTEAHIHDEINRKSSKSSSKSSHKSSHKSRATSGHSSSAGSRPCTASQGRTDFEIFGDTFHPSVVQDVLQAQYAIQAQDGQQKDDRYQFKTILG